MKTENYIFYQIYPKSFCDSNGDGIGDFQGIISKIPYLKELGVTAVWISPCFPSPFVDNGYDISDYRAVDERFGSMQDFDEMLEKFHESGIKVILDFVANHTSSEHFWFQEARKSKDNPYRDYYIWRQTPPKNTWRSTFGGSAWEYDEGTKEYYLHSFAVEQPDLNWENPKVRKEMREVLEFWVKKGVDGFRCDVLDMIFKDFEKGLKRNGEKLHEYIRELFKDLPIFTVGECWSTNAENVEKFCGRDREELTAVFNFEHLLLKGGRFGMQRPPLKELCEAISGWQVLNERLNILPTLFLENHDQPRATSRFIDDINYRYEGATMLGGLVLLHRGIPFIYQGQEFGMTNFEGKSMADFDDVETIGFYKEHKDEYDEETLLRKINFGGRDNPRVMMPWTGERVKSWMADYTRREEVNLEKDRKEEKSIFAFFKKLIALRKEEKAITLGTYTLRTLNDEVYVFERRYGEEKIVVYLSFENGAKFDFGKGKILLDNYAGIVCGSMPYRLVVVKES